MSISCSPAAALAGSPARGATPTVWTLVSGAAPLSPKLARRLGANAARQVPLPAQLERTSDGAAHLEPDQEDEDALAPLLLAVLEQTFSEPAEGNDTAKEAGKRDMGTQEKK